MDGDAIDQLAEQLRSDPVVIDVAMGSGRAEEYDDRLTALVKELPFKVYVALVEQPAGLPDDASDQLSVLLHKRIAEPGLYVVETTSGIMDAQGFGIDYAPRDGPNLRRLDEQVAAEHGVRSSVPEPVIEAEVVLRTVLHQDQYRDAEWGELTLPEAELADLTRRASVLYGMAQWDEEPADRSPVHDNTMEVGLPWAVGAASGSLVLAVMLVLLRNLVPGRRRAKVDLGRLRGFVTGQVETLAAELASTDWSTVLDRDAADRAALARDAAEPLLDSDELVDLVGAQVLASTGLADLEIARTGRGEPYRPCYVDPRHGKASAEMRWRLGQGDVQVPVCARCRAADTAGTPREPMPRERHGEHRRLEQVPYYTGDDVWARTGFGALTDELARDVLRAREARRR